MPPRWTGDRRGHGIGDASRVAPGIQELLSLSRSRNWIAEAPESHLLPHLRRVCERAESPFDLQSTELDPKGAFIVNLAWRGESPGIGQIRSAVVALVGEIAETATYIRQRRDPLTFEVLTGIPAAEGPFETHGHLLIVRVTTQPP